jgi:hypothetical protein
MSSNVSHLSFLVSLFLVEKKEIMFNFFLVILYIFPSSLFFKKVSLCSKNFYSKPSTLISIMFTAFLLGVDNISSIKITPHPLEIYPQIEADQSQLRYNISYFQSLAIFTTSIVTSSTEVLGPSKSSMSVRINFFHSD